MSSGIEELLDEVDRWKSEVHDRLKGMSPKERSSFWAHIGEQARKMGLRVVEPDKPPAARRSRGSRRPTGPPRRPTGKPPQGTGRR